MDVQVEKLVCWVGGSRISQWPPVVGSSYTKYGGQPGGENGAHMPVIV
jgi:hypothetical protein